MKTYGDLNLKEIRENNWLDFAHYTYLSGQCTCCYGPMDMPARYWHKSKKPVKVEGKPYEYELDGKPFDKKNMRYILFDNAYNCDGSVKKKDRIKDYTTISYSKNLPAGLIEKICRELAEQLDEDYIVVIPKTVEFCILIRVPEEIPSWRSEKKELMEMRQERVSSGAAVAWEE